MVKTEAEQTEMQFELFKEAFTNKESNEEITGITIVVDGDLKRVMDTIIKLDPTYRNYTVVVASAFVKGINKTAVIYKDDELIIFEDDLYNEKTKHNVKGIRIMIAGKLKVLLDDQIGLKLYNNYSEAVSTNLKTGLNEIINGCKGCD